MGGLLSACYVYLYFTLLFPLPRSSRTICPLHISDGISCVSLSFVYPFELRACRLLGIQRKPICVTRSLSSPELFNVMQHISYAPIRGRSTSTRLHRAHKVCTITLAPNTSCNKFLKHTHRVILLQFLSTVFSSAVVSFAVVSSVVAWNGVVKINT